MTDTTQNTASSSVASDQNTSHSGEAVNTQQDVASNNSSGATVSAGTTSMGTATTSISGDNEVATIPVTTSSGSALFSPSSSYVKGTATIDPNTGMTTGAGTATIYIYDSNGIFISSQAVSVPAGVSAPAHSTFTPPTANVPTGKVEVFTSTASTPGVGYWQLEDDHRGETVYDKLTGAPIIWNAPGEISSNYTSTAPTSPYDKWDASQNAWVLDKAAQHAALVSQATDIMRGQIMPNLSLFQLMGQTPGPQYKAYIGTIQGIAYGIDTTTTTLPTAPVNPFL
ncbi:MAG: hypothetical protein [Bacteriophage sp.]|nr:MAG: hypothetical protein [Bacteriophage sp.]